MMSLVLTQLPPQVREMKACLFFDTYHGNIVEALKAIQDKPQNA